VYYIVYVDITKTKFYTKRSGTRKSWKSNFTVNNDYI
jgi:hypothetical protein